MSSNTAFSAARYVISPASYYKLPASFGEMWCARVEFMQPLRFQDVSRSINEMHIR